jgi:DNA repair protein RadC
MDYDGHRRRYREQFRKSGLQSFEDYKKLEFLLFYAVPRWDTKPAAHRLLERFGSLSGVFDADYEKLLEVDGIGESSATLIKLAAKLMQAYDEDKASGKGLLKDPDHAIAFMRHKFKAEQRECMYMACLGNNGRLLYCKRVAEGSPDTLELSPAEIVRTAILANAVHVVLAHNHPYGLCNPSRQDIRTTNILYDELQRVNVNLADHIIVAGDGEFSMKRHNLYPGFWK